MIFDASDGRHAQCDIFSGDNRIAEKVRVADTETGRVIYCKRNQNGSLVTQGYCGGVIFEECTFPAPLTVVYLRQAKRIGFTNG
jgi:hypothetical protein